MQYISTRGGVSPIEFQDAVLMGLADDGGLVIPQSIPDVRHLLSAWRDMSYNELAMEVLRLFATDIPKRDLRKLIDRAYAAENWDGGVAPTVKVGQVYVLELWHGPTLAFKDVALQLLGNLFEYVLGNGTSRLAKQCGGRVNILGATSGDTGSAAIYGVRGRQNINIFVIHPRGRVSPIQERQMTTVLDENVHNIALEGSFDDCQRIMKDIAGDLDFKRKYSLGAVNSVNWARVLAQIVYYFKAAFDVQRLTGAAAVQVSVPTGNFGDVLAGWYAMQMGAPISRLILATNVNDILSRFFNTGEYSLGNVVHTNSPSMDIQVASNFERYLYYKVGSDPKRLGELMSGFAKTGSLKVPVQAGTAGGCAVDAAFVAGAADEEQVLATIANYWRKHKYVLDPHTAVGVSVAQRMGLSGEPVICLATAHPAKFPAAIQKATGKDIARHPAIDALMDLPTRCKVLPNDQQAVRMFIEDTLK